MPPESARPPWFRPSDSTPHRFYLWLCLLALGASFLFFCPPYLYFLGVVLMSLGGMAGRRPAEPPRGLTPRAFLAAIYLSAFAFLGVGLTLYIASSASQSPIQGIAMPRWAKVIGALAVAVYLSVETHRFLSRRALVAV